MAVTRSHLRQISRNAYATTTIGANAALGPVVPAGKKMHVHYAKFWQDGQTGKIVILFRDGATGSVALDYQSLPGYGASGGMEGAGEPHIELSLNIDTSIYILESGQQMGIGSAAVIGPANAFGLIGYYFEP